MSTLITSNEVMALLGTPEKESQMVLWDVPSSLELGAIPKKVYCSKLLPTPLEEVFRNIISAGIVDQVKTWDGCFNIRRKKGGNTYSMHAWGLAIDINASWNGFGKKPTMSKELVECFTSEGFIWGGTWRTPDGMHFELSKEFILRHS